MLRRAIAVGTLCALAALGLTRIASAEVVTITGVVKAASANAEEAATVKVGDLVYKVVKDDNGKIVARDAKDKKVEMKGDAQDKNGVKWITVVSCKLVE